MKQLLKQYKQSKKTSGKQGFKKINKLLNCCKIIKGKTARNDIKRAIRKKKNAQIKVKDETISEFGLKFAKLADQAQQLNLVDKSQLIKSKQETASNEKTVEKTPKNSKKEKRFWQFWK